MKTKVIAAAGVSILVLAFLFAIWPRSFDSKFDKLMEKMESYVLQGKMEITKGEDVKTYALNVAYQKAKIAKFKVSLTDKDLNQEQTIIRNDAGVFVVTPSLNQVFKFEGDWPMNTPKPYLLQSILEVVNQKNTTIKKEKGGYLIRSNVSYPSNKAYHHEEIQFDKDAKLKWLIIYNKDNNEELKIIFDKVEYNPTIAKQTFKEPTILKKSDSTSAIQAADLPLFPMSVHRSILANRTKMKVNGEEKHVLEYSGTKSFTLIETKKKEVSNTQTIIMPGEVVDALDMIGYYDGNHVSVIHDNVEFSVYSEQLTPDEMLEVINSMQVAVMK